MQSDTATNSDPISETQPREQPDREAQPVGNEQPPRLPFPVIGIGASAGGLEAFTEFLAALDADSGMAYVFIQHLPPAGESLLVNILSKRTALAVVEVAEGLAVEPNHVYVIRPGHTLTISDGRLHLGERLARPMHNRPVDDFFKSLANDQRQRAVGIILSGMGSNGAAGAQAIKAVGGICIAQEPESAQFPSMPQHLIEAGYADYVLRPQDIPGVLVEYARHPYTAEEADSVQAAERDPQHLREILAVLRTRTQQDFNGYKKPTVFRRVQRRMGLNRINRLSEYAKLLRQSTSEVTALADDLLIHVTGFFRDAEAWEALRRQVIAPLVKSREGDSSIRCWVAACASGEEAYSLAMLLVEEAERADKPLDIKVFATDMAERTLANARNGTFPGGIEADIEPKRLERFFQREDAIYRVRQDLRERVVFAPQNLLQDPPFSRLDIVTCRNLLIYLEPAMQQRVLALLHFGLREGGTLFLGSSETAGGHEQLFEPIDKKARLYRRIGPTRHGSVDFPLPRSLGGPGWSERNPNESRSSPARPSIAQLSTHALLEHHTPPAVTIDRDRRIVYYHGNTEPFIGAPRGEPTRDLMELARDNVRGAVRTAIQRASAGEGVCTAADGWVEVEPGKRVRIAVTASLFDNKSAQGYMVVSFHERGDDPQATAPHANGDGQDAESADELRRTREELQSTIEELQTSNEELKASHEEVVSVNEELQSSNEELETSREEMQSLNEELTTVNSQLHLKIEEHQAARNDLASLLTSTNIAVLFLDTRMHIRRFTPQVRDLFEMLESDMGRPVTDLATKFSDPQLRVDAERVLSTLTPIEREVAAEGDRWFLRRVTPYRTAEDRIDGVVISFIEITSRLKAENALRSSEVRAREQFARSSEILESISDAFYAVDADFRFTYVNRKTELLWGRRREDLIGRHFWTEFPQLVHTQAQQMHLQAMQTRQPVQGELGSPILNRWIDMTIYPEAGGGLSCYFRDITERKEAADALRASEERFRLLVEGASDFAMLLVDPSGVITAWNDGAERLIGYTAQEAVGMDASVIFTEEDRASGAPEREIGQAKRTGKAQDERWHLRKDGSRFWGSGVMTALRQPDKSIRGYVKVFRDETARKNVEDALLAAKVAAEQASTAKDEFLAVLSHELRTPLSAILLWVRLLSGKAGSDPQQLQEGLSAINSSAEAQRELIEDLLDISRINSGNLRLQMHRMDPVKIVHDAVEAITPVAEAKGVALHPEIGADVGTILADADRLRQVVWNLLTNAVKFTPANGQIRISIHQVGSEVVIQVIDTGRGISADFLPYIFERFSQAEAATTRTQGGMGLGLAICKQLIELHSGTISAESAGPSQGSTFTVRLPLSKESAASSTAPGPRGRDKQVQKLDASKLKGVKVLLVEDDAMTRRALASVLSDVGMEVFPAGSVDAALESFERHAPAIIVSDIGMPEKDGYALLKEIRGREARSGKVQTPAVALTAFAGESDRTRAIEAGFQTRVAKPVDADGLLGILLEQLVERLR